MRHLAVILNPKSGSSETSESEIRKLFDDHDIQLKFFDITKGLDVLTKAIKAHKPQALIAVGGDGTVNATANLAVRLDLPMGVIPSGTLNHFAKDMGLPMNPQEAADLISRGKLIAIDYGSINDRVFVNNANLGGYPEVVLKRDKLSILNNKWLSAIVASIQTFRRHQKQSFELSIDGQQHKVRAGSLFIGNNAYELQGLNFTSRQNLDQGNLQLVVIKTGRLRHLSSIGINFILRNSHEKVDEYQAKELEIRSSHSDDNVAIDGEVIKLSMPLTIKIHAKALKVFGQ